MVAISNDYYYIQSSNQHYYRFGEILESSELLDLFRGRSPAHVDLHAETSVDSDDTPVLQLPYQSRFARSQSRPALHAGIVMTAMDSAMGLATMLAMEELSSLATLELRYDELRPPQDEDGIFIKSHCDSIDDGIAYLTSTASDSSGIFARAVARFILTPGSTSFMEAAMAAINGEQS
jgi:acyl-coenzyme A thioesterase PaaI-like protein